MLDPEPARRDRQRQNQRRYRQRQRDGAMVAPAAISAAVVDMLVGLRWLDEAEAADRFAVGRALAAMAEDTAKHR